MSGIEEQKSTANKTPSKTSKSITRIQKVQAFILTCVGDQHNFGFWGS